MESRVSDSSTDTVVVGASAAGLAVGACLKRAGVPFVVVEKSNQVASAWRKHYDRLHLHTSKGFSGLPYLPMPRSYPKYPSRDQVVEYMETYAKEMEIDPVFGQQVEAIVHRHGQWETRCQDRTWTSTRVVIATGYTRKPYAPAWPGREEYSGRVMHSSEYVNGAEWQGRRALVVGFGNSAGEIALDLFEHGAKPALSVRGAVNAIPRDLFGIPILGWGVVLRFLPMKVADLVSKPLLWASIGDIRDTGLKRLPYGPNEQVRKYGRIPLLDIGTIRRLRQGEIQVHPGIDQFTSSGVVFADGRKESFEAVILATGYRPDLSEFLKVTDGVLDEEGASASGMLREIGFEAKRIAGAIHRRRHPTRPPVQRREGTPPLH
jgi:thioredoxin reductase